MHQTYIIVVICIFLLLVYFVTVFWGKPGYYWYMPTDKSEHPNSYVELCEVLKQVNGRTNQDELFYSLTDSFPEIPFHEFLKKTNYKYSRNDLANIMNEPREEILALKSKYNRVRPYQLCPDINMVITATGWTPSYPAGHAYQAYYLAKKLYTKHPELKDDLLKIAEAVDTIRVKGGIHYPSDGLFSRKLVLGY
jgi:hypothetical protein